jgi:hypothetical protein
MNTHTTCLRGDRAITVWTVSVHDRYGETASKPPHRLNPRDSLLHNRENRWFWTVLADPQSDSLNHHSWVTMHNGPVKCSPKPPLLEPSPWRFVHNAVKVVLPKTTWRETCEIAPSRNPRETTPVEPSPARAFSLWCPEWPFWSTWATPCEQCPKPRALAVETRKHVQNPVEASCRDSDFGDVLWWPSVNSVDPYIVDVRKAVLGPFAVLGGFRGRFSWFSRGFQPVLHGFWRLLALWTPLSTCPKPAVPCRTWSNRPCFPHAGIRAVRRTGLGLFWAVYDLFYTCFRAV